MAEELENRVGLDISPCLSSGQIRACYRRRRPQPLNLALILTHSKIKKRGLLLGPPNSRIGHAAHGSYFVEAVNGLNEPLVYVLYRLDMELRPNASAVRALRFSLDALPAYHYAVPPPSAFLLVKSVGR